MNRKWIAPVVIAVLVGFLSGSAFAEDKKPVGTLKLSEGSVAVGLGWSWGHGTLTFGGKDYKVKVEGLSVGEVGMTDVKAKGDVYDLKSVDDFSGVFAAAGAGFTAGGGKGASAWTNAKGVTVVLTSITKGASLKIAAEGLKLTIEK
jgi:hypothetical protein